MSEFEDLLDVIDNVYATGTRGRMNDTTLNCQHDGDTMKTLELIQDRRLQIPMSVSWYLSDIGHPHRTVIAALHTLAPIKIIEGKG